MQDPFEELLCELSPEQSNVLREIADQELLAAIQCHDTRRVKLILTLIGNDFVDPWAALRFVEKTLSN